MRRRLVSAESGPRRREDRTERVPWIDPADMRRDRASGAVDIVLVAKLRDQALIRRQPVRLLGVRSVALSWIAGMSAHFAASASASSQVGAMLSGMPLCQRPTSWRGSSPSPPHPTPHRRSAETGWPAARHRRRSCRLLVQLAIGLKVPLRVKAQGWAVGCSSCASLAWPRMNSPVASGASPCRRAAACRRRSLPPLRFSVRTGGEGRIGDAVGEAEMLLRRRNPLPVPGRHDGLGILVLGAAPPVGRSARSRPPIRPRHASATPSARPAPRRGWRCPA